MTAREIAEWPKVVAKMIADYPALAAFIDTFDHPQMNGAGKGVFRGQTCRMVLDVMQQATIALGVAATAPPKPLEVLQALCVTLEEDFLLALRFLYYVKAKSVVPDAMYDAAERDFIDRPEILDSPLMNPGSDNPDDYPLHVRALAFYLSMMGWQRGQEAGVAEAAAKSAKTPKKQVGKVIAEYVKEDLFS